MTTTDELRALAAAATPGPWHSDPTSEYVTVDAADGKAIAEVIHGKHQEADAALIAATRNELDRLLADSDEVARLRPLLEAARDEHGYSKTDPGRGCKCLTAYCAVADALTALTPPADRDPKADR